MYRYYVQFIKNSTLYTVRYDYSKKKNSLNRSLIYSLKNIKTCHIYHNTYRHTNALTKIISVITICIKRFLVNFSAAIPIYS